jgi:hypothetical protein
MSETPLENNVFEKEDGYNNKQQTDFHELREEVGT